MTGDMGSFMDDEMARAVRLSNNIGPAPISLPKSMSQASARASRLVSRSHWMRSVVGTRGKLVGGRVSFAACGVRQNRAVRAPGYLASGAEQVRGDVEVHEVSDAPIV